MSKPSIPGLWIRSSVVAVLFFNIQIYNSVALGWIDRGGRIEASANAWLLIFIHSAYNVQL